MGPIGTSNLGADLSPAQDTAHRGTRMSFELGQLREAAEKYTYHDPGTHGVWPRLVWERRNESPVARLDDAVEFLGKWKALRFKGGGRAFRGICTNWLRKNLTGIQRLHGKVLYTLAPKDFQCILDISSSFRDCGAPSPTYGKALHFFLPETVMLWDQAIVRNTYKLRPEPESFVSYQRFGWKLLRHVTRGKTVKVLRQLEKDHARSTGYFEPMTMILDHLAFSPKAVRKSRCSTGRIFSGAFTRSFMMTVVAPLTVVLQARWPEGELYDSWPCSWRFLRKKVQPSTCSSLVFFASEFFAYPSCRRVSLVPPFGIEWKTSVTLVTSIDSWSHFHVKPSLFPLSNTVNLPRRCQSCLGQEK